MPGQQRYKYGGADTDDTDYYLAKLTGDKDATKPRQQPGEVPTTDYHRGGADLQGDSQFRTIEVPQTPCSKAARVFLGVMSVLLFICSAGALAIMLIRETPIKHLWALAYYGAVSTSAAGLLAGILGLVGACTRNTCAKTLFMFLAILFAVACLGGGVMILLVDSHHYKLESTWETMVTDFPSAICTFEKNYKCSGWSTSCNGTKSTQTGLSALLTAAASASSGSSFAISSMSGPSSASADSLSYYGGSGSEFPVVSASSAQSGPAASSTHDSLSSASDSSPSASSYASQASFSITSGSSGSISSSSTSNMPASGSSASSMPASGSSASSMPASGSSASSMPASGSSSSSFPASGSSASSMPASGSSSSSMPASGSSAASFPMSGSSGSSSLNGKNATKGKSANTYKVECTSCIPEHRTQPYTRTCEDSFHITLHHHVPIALGVAFGLAVLCVAAAVAAYKSRRILVDAPDLLI